MYSIILAAFYQIEKKILNIISSIYFSIFKTDEIYIYIKNDIMKKMVGIENIYDI